MKDRLFRQHIAILMERKRREAETQVQVETEVQKKPPVSAKLSYVAQPTPGTRK